jgi:hypothetical protein
LRCLQPRFSVLFCLHTPASSGAVRPACGRREDLCVRVVSAIVVCLCVLSYGSDAAARSTATRVQDVIDDLRARLSIPQAVAVSIVLHNPLMVSVGRQKDHQNAFVLSIEETFLDGLSDDELCSVVAHELGHVWIYTHHPYLQTEEGANQVALRVVTREDLERLYGKVWQRTGAPGDLVYIPSK